MQTPSKWPKDITPEVITRVIERLEEEKASKQREANNILGYIEGLDIALRILRGDNKPP